MKMINNYKDLIKLIETQNNFNQILEAVYLFHYTNFKTPLFLNSINKLELKNEIQIIEKNYIEIKKIPIFGTASI